MELTQRAAEPSAQPEPLSEAELDLPDEALGRRLLDLRLRALAGDLGRTFESFSALEVEQWTRRIAQQETDTAALGTLEKALRLAAQGEFARAGKALRAHILDMGQRLSDGRHAAQNRARVGRMRDGGAKGGSKPKPTKRKLPENVKDEYAALLKAGRAERDARSILVQKYGVSTQGLGKALK